MIPVIRHELLDEDGVSLTLLHSNLLYVAEAALDVQPADPPNREAATLSDDTPFRREDMIRGLAIVASVRP